MSTGMPETIGKVKVLYIAGYVRSGSTLLDLVLGQVPGMFSIGEFDSLLHAPNFSVDRICTCGLRYYECPFWSSVVKDACGGWENFDRDHWSALFQSTASNRQLPLVVGLRTARRRAQVATYARELARMYRAIQEASGCAVIVDSSKVPNYGLILTASTELDVHVVHLIRDSRAVAFSQSRMPRSVVPESELPPRRSTARSVVAWTKANLMSELLGRSARSYQRVRYEDFAERPKEVVGQILNRIGEARDLSFIDNHAVVRKVSHNVAGNPMRFKRGEIVIKADVEWKEKMGLLQRTVVAAGTVLLLRRYGYAK